MILDEISLIVFSSPELYTDAKGRQVRGSLVVLIMFLTLKGVKEEYMYAIVDKMKEQKLTGNALHILYNDVCYEDLDKCIYYIEQGYANDALQLVNKVVDKTASQWRQELIAKYEDMYGITSEQFEVRWNNGDIEDTFETNHWADLLRRD